MSSTSGEDGHDDEKALMDIIQGKTKEKAPEKVEKVEKTAKKDKKKGPTEVNFQAGGEDLKKFNTDTKQIISDLNMKKLFVTEDEN